VTLAARPLTRRFARRSIVILGPLAVAVLVLPVLTLAWRFRLPPEAALSPAAADQEARLPWPALNVVTAGWALIGVSALALWLYRHRLSPIGVRWPAPFTWAAGTAIGLHSAALAAGNVDRTEPEPMRELWWASPLPMAVAAAAAAALGWVLAGRDPALPVAVAVTGPGQDAPRLFAQGPGMRVIWCRPVSSRRALALAALLAVGGTFGALTGLGVVGALAIALAVVVALHAEAVVRIDPNGIAVTQPLLRRSLIALPYDRIEGAKAMPSPAGLPRRAYGFVADGPVFGYRSRPKGPALALAVAGGRECVLTVDDPETAAALINTRIDALRAPGPTRRSTC
jgi:hypothetical protein